MARIAFCSLAFLACLLTLGCGSGYSTVTGTVTLDGAPLASATVMFTSEDNNRVATGFTDASGNFTMTADNKDGVLPGKYKVSVSKTGIIEGQSPAMAAAGGAVDPNYLKTAMKAKAAVGGPKSGPPGGPGGPGGKGGNTPTAMSKEELPKIYATPDKSPLPMVEVPVSGAVKLDLKSKP